MWEKSFLEIGFTIATVISTGLMAIRFQLTDNFNIVLTILETDEIMFGNSRDLDCGIYGVLCPVSWEMAWRYLKLLVIWNKRDLRGEPGCKQFYISNKSDLSSELKVCWNTVLCNSLPQEEEFLELMRYGAHLCCHLLSSVSGCYGFRKLDVAYRDQTLIYMIEWSLIIKLLPVEIWMAVAIFRQY